MPGKKLTRDDLTLVSDFSIGLYPYAHKILFDDHLSSAERQFKRLVMERALSLASIRNYKIFDNYYDIELRLLNEDDWDRINVALSPDGKIEHGFAFAPEGYDFRKLKHHGRKIQESVRKTHLVGQVYIEADREERALIVIAHNKGAYLGFRSLIADKLDLNF